MWRGFLAGPPSLASRRVLRTLLLPLAGRIDDASGDEKSDKGQYGGPADDGDEHGRTGLGAVRAISARLRAKVMVVFVDAASCAAPLFAPVFCSVERWSVSTDSDAEVSPTPMPATAHSAVPTARFL
jgi:hypothetical protein